MFKRVTFLILLLRFSIKSGASRACVPNSQIFLKGKVCICNNRGHWSESNCRPIERRQTCRPGQVVFQGCSRCVCQSNGQLSCSETTTCKSSARIQNVHKNLETILPSCKPFRTYYISCNICVCPASGRTTGVHCALDASCTLLRAPTTSDLSSKKNTCIPRVMYLFPCLHCLCSEDGFFILTRCVETCARPQIESGRRCIPKTLYRNHCNVCLCPENSIPDDKLCTSAACSTTTSYVDFRAVNNKPSKCTPYEFTKSRCVYCNCNHNGVIDEKNCLNLPCLRSEELKYDIARESCSPGEMVPICTECLCTRKGVTVDEYCTKACSYNSKLQVLEKVAKMPNSESINDKEIITMSDGDICKPNSIFIEKGKYCLCPTAGNLDLKLCLEADMVRPVQVNNSATVHISIDFNASCEPSTFVEFDCNTCFCSKTGRIDPKWCTYDDCESKRIIQESHAVHQTPTNADKTLSDTCNPGSISNVDCNFCICPDSGHLDDRVCTKNDCSSSVSFFAGHNKEKLTCEPLAYYEVDCNICYCPRDGIKNVAKCTKNLCEKNNNILRSEVCVPGQLFSDECNVCICPPNGNKLEKACTNYTCTETVPWRKIFQLSESLLSNQIAEDETRNLELCFPGEEFVVGCKLCVCPDIGMRLYATCSPTFCDDERHERGNPDLTESNRQIAQYRRLNTRKEKCEKYMFVNNTASRESCSPGSMYIIRCKECICPYSGDIANYCRPLPKSFYCEQAYPGFNYFPMGRRNDDVTDNSTEISTTTTENSANNTTPINITTEPTSKYSDTSINSTYVTHSVQSTISPANSTSLVENITTPDSILTTTETDNKTNTTSTSDLSAANKTSVTSSSDQSETNKMNANPSSDQSAANKTNVSSLSDQLQANKTNANPLSDQSEANKTNASPLPNQSAANKTYVSSLSDQLQANKTNANPLSDQSEANKTNASPLPNQSAANKTNATSPPEANKTNATSPSEANKTNANPSSYKLEPKKNESSVTNEPIFKKPDKVEHDHTRYECNTPGKIKDDCFMCECDGESFILEHCFKKDEVKCEKSSPTFLLDVEKFVDGT